MTLSRRTLLLSAAMFLSAFPRPTPNPAPACAVAPPRDGHVSIFDESAIIVWDAATKTEHFIRRAAFQATVKDFGFIVPTPSKPTLTEVDDQAFAEFARITPPKTVTRPRQPSPVGCEGSAVKGASRPPNRPPPNPRELG